MKTKTALVAANENIKDNDVIDTPSTTEENQPDGFQEQLIELEDLLEKQGDEAEDRDNDSDESRPGDEGDGI